MTTRIGLAAGTVFYRQEMFKDAKERHVKTPFGPARLILTDRLAYLPRHGLDGQSYIFAHAINHPANFFALKDLGVEEVIAICSTGSLKPSLAPGNVVLPSDYICLGPVPTTVSNHSLHITPVLSEAVRLKLAEAARRSGVEIVDGGVYWQSTGPRLETRAEIRLISDYAHLVGMTMASEAAVAQELGLAYAALCSVDNYAHGLSHVPLTEDEIRSRAAENAEKMVRIVEAYLRLPVG